MTASEVAGTAVLRWLPDPGPASIPPDLLDRVMLLGVPTTLPDGSRVEVGDAGPQAHLAIQGAATSPLRPHFHGVEQFQCFVRGAGSIGRHAVRTGVVHYTDRYGVYGPLTPGPDGMAYLTLRPAHDPGASYMPASRAELAALLRRTGRRAGRRRTATLDLAAAPPAPAAWHDLLAAPDGLRVAVADPAPGEPLAVPVVGGAGAYLVVVAGALAGAGAGATAWLAPGTAAAVTASAGGGRVALLQFPAV